MSYSIINLKDSDEDINDRKYSDLFKKGFLSTKEMGFGLFGEKNIEDRYGIYRHRIRQDIMVESVMMKLLFLGFTRK